eukprot:g7462.t1
MGDSASKARARDDSRRTKDGKKKRKRRPDDPPKKKKKKAEYTAEQIAAKIEEGALKISDAECFRELISQLSTEQQGEFLDLLLIQQEELLQQYRSGASILQPTISPSSAQEYQRKKEAGLIDPETTILQDLQNLVKERAEKKSPGSGKKSESRQSQSVKDFCDAEDTAGGGKEVTKQDREAALKEYLTKLKLDGAGSDSSSDYVTDDEYEADFEGKSLERVSQEADFALAEAMKMLEMDDEK